MTKIKLFSVIIAMLLVAGVGYYIFSGEKIEKFPFSLNFFSQDKKEENTLEFGKSDSETAGGLSEIYTNSDYGFSFNHSKEFRVGSFEEGEGDVILVQRGSSDGFQIYITEFDEPGPITAERIRKDIPDIIIEASQQVSIGGEPAFVFISKDDSIGQTREVWFVHAGFLYQITAPIAFDADAAAMMATFNFE